MQYPISAAARASLVALALAACDSENPQRHLDASVPADGSPDAPADAACMKTLLTGGTDIGEQGWIPRTQQGPVSITYGADYVQLQTTTVMNDSTGGQLLLAYADAVTPGMPFKIEVVMLVQAVATHNQFDAAATIMGSLTGIVGLPAERAEMIYLDAAAIGWADDSQSHAVTITDGAYHTYVLAVDAAGTATVSMDGTVVLTRPNFTTNGAIAIGDQTNEPTVDSTLRIKSVRLLCP